MADEKNTSPDDEYQFPQEEYSGSEAGEESQKIEAGESPVGSQENLRKKVVEGYRSTVSGRNKRILFVVVGLLCLIGFLKVSSMLHESPKMAKESVHPTVQASGSQPVQAQPVVQQPEPTAETPLPQPTMPTVGPSDTSLDEMRAYHSQADGKMQELQSQVSSMQKSLAQSESSNEQLQKSVVQLAQQVQTLSTALKQQMLAQEKQPKQKRAVFYLRAVVPDRAWVMTSSGETVSVSVGDSLDQYGTIQSIDPVYGVIETSSGRKITYGSNDY